jgi:hypothetical protein
MDRADDGLVEIDDDNKTKPTRTIYVKKNHVYSIAR